MVYGVTRRHQEDKPLTGAVENLRRLGMIRPRDFVPSPSLRRAARCWPSAGLRGDQWRCHRKFSGLCVVVGHCGGTEDRGLLAPHSTCPESSGRQREAGVAPAVHSEGPAPSATPRHNPLSARLARKSGASCNRGCGTCVVGRFGALGTAVQRRPHKYSVVTGALVAGRAVTYRRELYQPPPG